ncbi:MAG: metallophosphoesterase [Spirochaetia bacterium]|nr:metallophosphoesterase [Spirochaetia bacterium]
MKIKINLFRQFFIFSLISISLFNCSIDDVNRRFHESLALPQPSPISIVDPNNFSFIHITDLHVVNGKNPHLTAFGSRLISTDAFIIASGDLTDNGQQGDFAAYGKIMKSFGIPYFSGIGNHDLWFGGWDSFKTLVGPSVYSTTAGNLRIIFLDTADDTIGADQLQWLKKELEQKTEPYCIVVSHYNFFLPTILETAMPTNMQEIYAMMRLFEKYRVDYVLMGHSHIYDYRKINGISYLVDSALKQYSANEQKYYNRITVSNGKMTHQRFAIY